LGLTLEYLAFGYRAAHRQFVVVAYPTLIILGLAVALITTVLPLLAGQSVLGRLETAFDVLLIGEIRLSRSMFFDVGIYLAVVGGAMTTIDQLRSGGT
ncbi:MAG TPA: MnhB domain-containing protein, partial [Chloroflexota bacterium]|nr:MnhB domain-containing protein [Chloroflexota bacterium]